MAERNKILVTGASGFFGKALVSYLAEKNVPVIAATRTGGGVGVKGVESLAIGSLPDLADLTDRLQQVKTIVHCAGRAHVMRDNSADPLSVFRQVNTQGTLALARQAVAAGVERFVFLSSIGVNGNQTRGTPFRASDTPAPQAPYAVSKLEAEQELKDLSGETGLEVVILRPPLIVGPNPVGNLATIAKLLATGLPLPFGLATRNKRSLVSVDNLCSLVEICISHPKAVGQVFVMAEAEDLNTRQIMEWVARETGQKARFVPVPVFLLRGLLKLAGKTGMDNQLFGDLEVDFAKTTKRLGWRPQPLDIAGPR